MSKPISYTPEPEGMGRLKKFGIGSLFVVGALVFIGSQVDPPEAPVTPPSATLVAPSPAPATVTVTNTETVAVPTVPQACLDYLSAVDAVTVAIYDYEAAIAPEIETFSDGTQAIADGDTQRLNDVKTRHNQALNATTGPLQDIVSSKPTLQRLKAACDDAKD